MIEITIYDQDMSHDEEQFLETVKNWGSPTSPPYVNLFGRKYFPEEISTVKSNGKNRTVVKLCSSGKVK